MVMQNRWMSLMFLGFLCVMFSSTPTAGEQTTSQSELSQAITDTELIRIATQAQEYSYSPYSHFAVGAALLTTDGQVYTGTNIENAAYGASVSAEQVALLKAVSEGHRSFSAIAVTSSGSDFTYPSGICRQVLSEFGLDIRVIMTNGTEVKVMTVGDLLPDAFGPAALPKTEYPILSSE